MLDDIDYWEWTLLASFVSTAYFFLVKYFIINKDPKIIASAISLELLVIYSYYKTLEHHRSGTTNAIINSLSVMLGVFVAILFFNETFKTQDVIGILFIITGILLIGEQS